MIIYIISEALLAQEELENTVKKPATKHDKPLVSKPLSHSLTSYETAPVAAYTASNIDDALNLLDLAATDSVSHSDKLDRHPERRMKSAYAAFEEREMASMKEENKGLRLTQLKQAIAKKWKKSTENPMVNTISLNV